ncbi:MAG: hypothetical protein KQH57_18690 [Actinomycetales bacterium]|nr:hypothetical protein [Actinomycetales bacterium]
MTSPAHPQPARHFGPTGPITWAFLTAEQETEQIKELRLWVEWLVWRFALDHRTIPECWAQHGAIVEELSALYTAWQDAYTHSAEAEAPLQWMLQFALARQRLRDWIAVTGCRSGEHRTPAR